MISRQAHAKAQKTGRKWIVGCSAIIGIIAVVAGVRHALPIRPYPLAVCIVTGDRLGDEGPPIVLVHQRQEIKLCCEPCIAEFKSDPAKHLAKLRNK